MDFAFSEEQDAFREAVRSFVGKHSPVAAARALHEQGADFDRDLWRRMGDELGLHGLHIPDARGGQGFGQLELAIVAEELGAELVCSPYLASSVIAAGLLAELPRSAEVDELLARVADGSAVGTLTDARSTVTVTGSGSSATVTGSARRVMFGASADLVLVVAADASGAACLLAVTPGTGVVTEPCELLDLTDRAAGVRFDAAPATLLAGGVQLELALERSLDRAAIFAAGQMLGGADACLRLAVAYSLERRQFGRPIATFQAMKHLCANMFVENELTRAAVHYAAWCASTDDPATARHASLAKALASDTYLFAADAALHVHGGIGFTWEHDSHLFLRRARSMSLELGDSRHHRERFLLTSGFPAREP